MIVLDTNVVSELMRVSPSEDVVEWVRRHPGDLLCTTAISVAEVRYGIARLSAGRRQSALRAAADEVFAAFSEVIFAFDEAAARHYGDVVVERSLAGEPISGFDAQIAAICRVNQVALATRNTDDFAGLGLELLNPWQRTG